MLGSIGSYFQGMRPVPPHTRAHETAFDSHLRAGVVQHQHGGDGVRDLVHLPAQGRAFAAQCCAHGAGGPVASQPRPLPAGVVVMQVPPIPLFMLSPQDRMAVEALYKEAREIAGPPPEPKVLSEAEKAREAKILSRLREPRGEVTEMAALREELAVLHGTTPLSEIATARVAEIQARLNKIFTRAFDSLGFRIV